MATVNLVDGARYTRDASGERLEIRNYIENTGPVNSRLKAAAATPPLPPFGAEHPTIPGIYLLEVSTEPAEGSTTQFFVRQIYRKPTEAERPLIEFGDTGPVTKSVDVQTVTEEVNRDVNGNLMLVTYFGSPVVNTISLSSGQVVTGEFTLANQLETKILRARVTRPRLQVRFARWERTDPEDQLLDIGGAVNAAPWRTFPAKTWLCANVVSRPRDEGGFDVEYSFIHKAESWTLEGAIEVFNQIPLDATLGNGIEIFDVYPLFDFNRLRLS